MTNTLGSKIAGKRKDLGMTQQEFADEMAVTRQTVSRWETGTVLPDIDKISDIAELLGVSCDYLLKDDVTEEHTAPMKGVGRLLESLRGKTVGLTFFDGEADIDLYNATCQVIDFEGNWMRVGADLKKGHAEKLIPLSSIRSFEILEEDR